MKQVNIDEITKRWKITDAFVKGIAKSHDSNIWYSKCDQSSFRTSFSYYTNVDDTYFGMLDNVNFFTDNCSVQGLLDYIYFYETQTNEKWKELYVSSVLVYQDKGRNFDRETNWWKEHLNSFSHFHL